MENQGMQQVMEMLAIIEARMAAHQARMDAMHKKMMAEMDASMKCNQEQILAKMTASEAGHKAQREKEAETEATRAKTDENLKETTARMDAWLTDTNDTREKTMACQENTEARLEGEEELTSEEWKTPQLCWSENRGTGAGTDEIWLRSAARRSNTNGPKVRMGAERI
jgi:hypothetical protein